ncbi:large ribosomal subunit protein mL41-like [Babylonia areolata]|uniref:large ribosomal subunit protein mL41-like n=1 Tax=Babylonia areolata TaxID=304850 RepID=UPI003FD44BD6
MWSQRLAHPARSFSTTACVAGRRSREPFDKRFPVTGKHGSQFRKGGSEMMEKHLAVHNVQPTGFYDKKKGAFRNVPEMIPNFVVPDLTGFPLKPYVSYKVKDIHQSKMTARDLFQATYATEITRDVKDGKVVVKDGEFVRLYTGDDEKR